MSESPASELGASDSSPADRRQQLRTQFATTELPRHLALFYRTHAEQMRVITTYVARGLQRNERVVYIADENDTETIAVALADAGLDVDALQADGQLVLMDSDEIYSSGLFDPEETVDEFRSLAADAVADGYAGLHVAGENSWSFGLDCSFDDVIEFEHRFDETCPELPVTALCQYSLEQFADENIGQALQTHEAIIYRETLCTNPYYTPPEEAIECGAPLSNAALLLEQTRDINQFRDDVERREERLSVVNRVLRHNLRNELNVISGRLEWLEEQGLFDEAAADHLDAIAAAAERLSTLSENARHVDRTLGDREPEPANLNDVVEAGVTDAVREYADLSVAIDAGPPDATAADATIQTSVREVLACAATNLSGPTVDVRVAADDQYETATVEVVADEGFVSEATRIAFDNESERSLAHANTLRLWVAQWTVQSMNGRLEFGGSTPADRVRFTVPTIEKRR
jgi:signal transduction histidine kinase